MSFNNRNKDYLSMNSTRANASAQGRHIVGTSTGTPTFSLHFADGPSDVQATSDSPEHLPVPTASHAERTKPYKASNSTERNMKPCTSCRISRQRCIVVQHDPHLCERCQRRGEFACVMPEPKRRTRKRTVASSRGNTVPQYQQHYADQPDPASQESLGTSAFRNGTASSAGHIDANSYVDGDAASFLTSYRMPIQAWNWPFEGSDSAPGLIPTNFSG